MVPGRSCAPFFTFGKEVGSLVDGALGTVGNFAYPGSFGTFGTFGNGTLGAFGTVGIFGVGIFGVGIFGTGIFVGTFTIFGTTFGTTLVTTFGAY